MERMCIPVKTPVQCSSEAKPPPYSDCVLPKKDPDHKVFDIKLPLDIDIRIHHHQRAITLLILLPWLCLTAVLFYLMSSLQQQLQLHEIEIATLRIESTKLSMQTFEIQNQLSQMELNLQKAEIKKGKIKETRRRKRDTENAGLNIPLKTAYEVNQPVRQDVSNKTMRGSVRAAHFKGLLPEKLVEAGQIGPWYEDQQAVGDFGLRNCNLRDRGVKLIVNETGLYLIYAQVYYLATMSLNSYSINVFPGNKALSVPVAFCSANASVNDQGGSEVSCFTSIVRKLQAGDGISLEQLERQRRLVMRDGRTFIGLVRLG